MTAFSILKTGFGKASDILGRIAQPSPSTQAAKTLKKAESDFLRASAILRRVFEKHQYTNSVTSHYNAYSNQFGIHSTPRMITSTLIFQDADKENLATVIAHHPPSAFFADRDNISFALNEYPQVAKRWQGVNVNLVYHYSRKVFEEWQAGHPLPKPMADEGIPLFMNELREADNRGEKGWATFLAEDFSRRFHVAHHAVILKPADPA